MFFFNLKALDPLRKLPGGFLDLFYLGVANKQKDFSESSGIKVTYF